jgi:UDP-GlcNAc:undecaprenyl-phosphate/decaprenyl-phosphate GlcNAc-1-phosphate transferase
MNAYFLALQPYIVPGFVAFALTFTLTALSLFFFPKWGLMDKPQKYGLKRRPIPYSGGLILYVVFFICAVIFMDFDKHLIGVTLAITLLTLVSFLDDRRGLSPLFRLFVQVLAALTVIIAGVGIISVTNPLGGLIYLDGWEIPFTISETVYHFTVWADLLTIVWIVAMINTLNWLDGLPGLVSGIGAIGAVVMFILSIRPDFHYIDQTDVAMLAVIIAGGAFAFWWFDFHPPKILMGDTGSMFLGFMLAMLAIFSGGKIATAFLIMGFPFLDAAWVIGRRIWQRKSPFKGDSSHFHHRLLKAGFTERQAIVLIYVVCALFGGMALFLGSSQKLIAIVVMVALMGVLGTMVVLRGKKRLF